MIINGWSIKRFYPEKCAFKDESDKEDFSNKIVLVATKKFPKTKVTYFGVGNNMQESLKEIFQHKNFNNNFEEENNSIDRFNELLSEII